MRSRFELGDAARSRATQRERAHPHQSVARRGAGGLATAFTRRPPPARSSKRRYYRDEGFEGIEGFIGIQFEVNEADLSAIFEEYLREGADIDFNEVEVTNKRPMNA